MLAAAILLAVLVICQLVALAWLTTEQAGHMERAEERHARQLGMLLQRIQAPEAAVMQHQMQGSGPDPEPPGFEDDEAFWATKEELAAALANELG